MSFNKFFSKKLYFFTKAKNFIKIYKFKIFKKTTRFKKYSIGPTKYIINRKKYQTRKKRSTNLLNYYQASLWSINYKKKAQVIKYAQTVQSFCKASILVSRNYIFKKTITLPNIYFSTSSASSNLMYNKTLFKSSNMWFYNLLHKNSAVGYVYTNHTPTTTIFSKIQPFNNINYNNAYFKDINKLPAVINKVTAGILGQLFLNKSISFIRSLYAIITLLSLLCINL